ncbi:MAG: recombinase family protein [Alphaproteobacteria bacterium]|nr:recombinase family protein [Alphaproteobacteria bacterium]
MKGYFAYIRVSTVRQGEHGSSLVEQKSAIEAYATRRNLPIIAWFEEKETAAKQGRPVFSRMLAQLERGAAHGVLIHKIDRSARNLKDWANLGGLIDRGIDVQFVHDSFDLHSRGGRLSADIQAVVAADFIRNLRDEVRKGIRGRLKQGFYPLPAPVGYIDKGSAQPKEIDPVLGPLVREAFESYANGAMGLRALRTEMTRRGLRSRSGHVLSLNALAYVLHNPFYIGLMRIKRTGETYSGNHTPLISKSLFDRVQAIAGGKTVIRTVRHEFAFRRLVKCGNCGLHLIPELQKGRYVYYRCQGFGCQGSAVREDALDHAIQGTLALLQCDATERQHIEDIATLIKADDEKNKTNLAESLRMRLAKCEARLAKLTDAFVDGTIDKELFENRKKVVLEERIALRNEHESLSSCDLPIYWALDNLELGNAALLSYKSAIPAEKRALVESLTSNFVLHGKKLEIALRNPFQELAKWRGVQMGSPRRVAPHERAKQILAILMTPDTASGKGAIRGNPANDDGLQFAA